MALQFYNSFPKKLLDNEINLVLDTINIIIMSNTYAFNAVHDFRNDITSEVVGTNYTTGGITLTGKSATAANPSVVTANDIVIAQHASGFPNGRKYAFCKIIGGASNADPLIAYGERPANFENSTVALTLDIPSNLFVLTA